VTHEHVSLNGFEADVWLKGPRSQVIVEVPAYNWWLEHSEIEHHRRVHMDMPASRLRDAIKFMELLAETVNRMGDK
jgi:hypothetical protein